MVENEEFRVEINAENFPDEVFREFVKANFDKDKDGFLSEDEICSVTRIFLNEKEISDLKGIENFICLSWLKCDCTKIQKLDVSNNPVLERLFCHDTEIEELDVSNNPALELLNCANTKIEELDVSNNSDLQGVNCGETKIKKLDVSGQIS